MINDQDTPNATKTDESRSTFCEEEKKSALAIWRARRWPEAAGGARGDPGKRRFAGGAVEGAPRACIRTQSAAARSVRVGGTERNARPPRGIRRLFSWPGERFAAKMPRANAKASKKNASAEEQELLRLRKELMEKQAKLKRVLAQEKRQGSGVLQAVRGPPSCAFARRTRSRRAFGMSWFLTPALTRPATPPTRSPRTQAPSARDDPQARNQGYVAHRALRFARWNRSRPARHAVRRLAETKNPYAASRFVREDV